MSALQLLILILVVAVVAFVAFVLVQRRRRSSGVIASRPGRRPRGGS